MKLKIIAAISALLLAGASVAQTQAPTQSKGSTASAGQGASQGTNRKPEKPRASSTEKTERGWFFFEDPPQEETPEEAPPAGPPVPREAPPPPKEERCKSKASWTPDCGFVNPGKDFEFQAKQRDALMERMTVAGNDPKAVEDFQYYMRWALERVAEVTNLWHWNMVQNPELDPTASQPINAMGLRLMTDVRKGTDAEYSKLLQEEGAFLIYFSKHDCSYCHSVAPLVKDLGKQLKIPVRNAAIDSKCIEGLEDGCVTAPKTTQAAQALQVSIVPTVFLYVPKNTFIRVATGVTDVATMKARTLQFFQASRTAMLKGVENGNGARSSVDFSTAEKGVTQKTGVSGSSTVPTDAEMKSLLSSAP